MFKKYTSSHGSVDFWTNRSPESQDSLLPVFFLTEIKSKENPSAWLVCPGRKCP
jgi:hypothetical protein